MSWQNRVFVVLLWPLIGLQTAFLRFPARCRLGPCCSSLWPTCSSLEKFLTHEWELSLFAEWSLFIDSIQISTPYLPCRQQVVASNTGPILVFPRIQPSGSVKLSSLGKVYSPQATESVYCENSSVSFVMKYCPTSTVVRNPASVQNLLTLSCCDNFSIRSLYLCNRSSSGCAGSSVKGMCVFITFGTNNGSDCPATTSLPVLSWLESQSSHISATAP